MDKQKVIEISENQETIKKAELSLLWIREQVSIDSRLKHQTVVQKAALLMSLKRLEKMIEDGELLGLCFGGISNRDNGLDIGMAGLAHDMPIIGAGITSKLQTLSVSFPNHPADYIFD